MHYSLAAPAVIVFVHKMEPELSPVEKTTLEALSTSPTKATVEAEKSREVQIQYPCQCAFLLIHFLVSDNKASLSTFSALEEA